MATRQEVIDAARRYLGVRWHHQGRSTAGVDCAGLVVTVAHELGLSDFDTTDYGRIPNGRDLRRICDANMDALPAGAYGPGDVLLMKFIAEPQHLAIVTDLGIIHAYANARKVVEHRLDSVWASRIVKAYRFRGIH